MSAKWDRARWPACTTSNSQARTWARNYGEPGSDVGCDRATSQLASIARNRRSVGWSWAAAGAVGRRLVVDLVDTRPDVPQEASLAIRCHQTITNEARVGWSAVTEIRSRIGSDEIETVLVRASTTVVIHAWDVVTRVAARLDKLQASMDREHSGADGAAVRGLVVVPSTHANRRRMTEEQALLQEAVPALAANWYGAIRNKHRPVPIDTGVLWLDRHGDRLLPAPLLPGWIWVTPDHGSRILLVTGTR